MFHKLKELLVLTPLVLIKQRFLALEERHQLDHLTPAQRLDPEVALRLREERNAKYERALRQQLRRYPRWRRGHLWLARVQIISKQFNAAILSGMAVQQICKGGGTAHRDTTKGLTQAEVEAEIILGLCYNRLRAFKLSLKHLTRAQHAAQTEVKLSQSLRVELLEELAAAYLGDNMKREAHAALVKIPPSNRNSSVEAMLRFLAEGS